MESFARARSKDGTGKYALDDSRQSAPYDNSSYRPPWDLNPHREDSRSKNSGEESKKDFDKEDSEDDDDDSDESDDYD